MAFTIINYKYNGMNEAKDLAEIMDQKMATLEKFIRDGAPVTCDVEFEKVTAQQQGRIFRVEANLTMNGELYRAEATEESFEKAIDVVRSELNQELRRVKEKKVTKYKKGGRTLKELITSFSVQRGKQ
ncbi:MAG TPA: ribosome-associated translation inhibitor RaiA [Candidatus Paceibacterota bacterium]